MSEKDAAYIIRQILSAITYCHSKGVVHRDIKPENILIELITVDGSINIKLIDFGAALFFTANSKITETLGTPYYIAPEVLLGNYTEKCDVWSIGVILFILLSGNAPFNGTTDEEIMSSVKRGVFSFKSRIWHNISPEAKDLVRKMLVFRPSERISAVDAFSHPWIQSKQYCTLPEEKTQELLKNIGNFHVILYTI